MSRRLSAVSAMLAGFAAVSGALAQSYPAKPVRLVVPSSPGGGTDITGRILAQKLSELLHQQVLVDNRAGAGTRIGNDIVAKSPPDGYTLLMGLSTLAIIPAVYKSVSYDALKDFAPISQAVSVPNVLVVHPSLPARSVKELSGRTSRSRSRMQNVEGSATPEVHSRTF